MIQFNLLFVISLFICFIAIKLKLYISEPIDGMISLIYLIYKEFGIHSGSVTILGKLILE